VAGDPFDEVVQVPPVTPDSVTSLSSYAVEKI
jgi:hypothetical protein